MASKPNSKRWKQWLSLDVLFAEEQTLRLLRVPYTTMLDVGSAGTCGISDLKESLYWTVEKLEAEMAKTYYVLKCCRCGREFIVTFFNLPFIAEHSVKCCNRFELIIKGK